MRVVNHEKSVTRNQERSASQPRAGNETKAWGIDQRKFEDKKREAPEKKVTRKEKLNFKEIFEAAHKAKVIAD